jgi:hypothetical protein
MPDKSRTHYLRPKSTETARETILDVAERPFAERGIDRSTDLGGMREPRCSQHAAVGGLLAAVLLGDLWGVTGSNRRPAD